MDGEARPVFGFSTFLKREDRFVFELCRPKKVNGGEAGSVFIILVLVNFNVGKSPSQVYILSSRKG